MQETTFDFRSIGRTIKNRRFLIANIFLGTIIIVMVFNFLLPPTFEAESILQVKQSKGLLPNFPSNDVIGTSSNSKLMSSYAEILKSRTVVQEVIDKTQGDKSPPPKYEEMLKRIRMQPIKDTDILKIKATANSPDEAQLLANTLVDSFINRLTSLARSEQTVVRELIFQRVLESRKELERCEKALEQYRRDQKILTPIDETKAIVDRMSSMKNMLANNAVATVMAQAKLNSAERQLAQESPNMIADNPIIQLYKTKLADSEVELVKLLQTYGEKHPKIMTTRVVIDETKAKLAQETTRVLNSESVSSDPIHQGLLQSRVQNEAELFATAAQKSAILSVIAESEKELTTLPAKEQGFSRLTRDVLVAQEIYLMLAKRYEEARISEVAQPADLWVIDVAAAPEVAISPQKTRNIIVGAVIGLLLGIGLAFLLEHLGRTIDNSQEAKQYLDLPVLGEIPDFNIVKNATTNGIVGQMQSLFDKVPKKIFKK